MHQNDTIIALATPSGAGAIAVIRLSGPEAIVMVDAFFKSIHVKKLASQKTHTIHLGHIIEGSTILDEVLVSWVLPRRTRLCSSSLPLAHL